MHILVVTVTVLALGLAGCAEEDSYRLGGAFTADRTQDDMEEFQRIVEPYSDDVAILESFPEQFAIHHIHHGCEELRAKLQAKAYIASVSNCTIEA